MTTTTRDRILDALETLLLDKGMSQVTLENVAAAAGVSKGGLLYHFKSKDALLAGLVRRLTERARTQLADSVAAGGSVAEWYLQIPNTESTDEALELELYRSLLATMRTVDATAGPETDVVQQALAEMMNSWSDGLDAEIDDPVRADLVRLVGDGIYLRALLGLPPIDPERYRRVVEHLLS
ncbi:TetR/AcrR family transcriptional regulator [Nocardia cyriacigeorgica]|uniref:TetR/AcrR family transcriptional regulator n=1 Tax=Nocardia cyriacigeorgica TaxID=135487 RepID=UPI000CEA3E32|nr:TetR/AcrR family transcriptional regulator [Nocardia cyriacigeorgica]AVH25068.1 TetR/AcrR family transcriptional regulator [Nocardia cyriacigeorgica]MBF6086104.1 TetR/AcrR family transcriptional regulator [Nocardia cyriacigeorgica]MBF6092194.1 TetR/AcrR family transcriptional regulator [Nocardia cyriacigeorgica]MBF6324324.1 TetR/AcrR family transcriptional regulator [Nocardia cyriacigeorgica]MBF6396788.1 TetR/AcrR family transcriptional regulator [Nocardia cyriacigeorgica]